MYRFIMPILFAALVSCQENTNNQSMKLTDGNNNGVPYTWSEEDEKEFLSGCIENTGGKMDEATAYANCKCVLDQLKRSFPNMDSAANVLMDTAKAATFAARCKEAEPASKK